MFSRIGSFKDIPVPLKICIMTGTMTLSEVVSLLFKDGMITEHQAREVMDRGLPSDFGFESLLPQGKSLAVRGNHEVASVDDAVRQVLANLFAQGPAIAALRLHILESSVKEFFMGARNRLPPCPRVEDFRSKFNQLSTNGSLMDQVVKNYPWQGCKLAASLISFICVEMNDAALRKECFAYYSHQMGGLPKMAAIKGIPSTSLSAKLRDALAAPTATLLMVGLSDLAILKAVEAGRPETDLFHSYAHSFTLLVSEEGVSLFQAWGKFGYTLQEWIKRNPTTMSPDEALSYTERFDKFVILKTWDDVTNSEYQALFGVDFRVAAAKAKLRVASQIKSWARVYEIKGVTFDRILDNSKLLLYEV